MTTLILDKKVWKDVHARIVDEYGERFFLISWRIKSTLGFHIRTHHHYVNGHYNSDIRLDFDDPALATFFQLKYIHTDGQ
jgi:hypothetical protein